MRELAGSQPRTDCRLLAPVEIPNLRRAGEKKRRAGSKLRYPGCMVSPCFRERDWSAGVRPSGVEVLLSMERHRPRSETRAGPTPTKKRRPVWPRAGRISVSVADTAGAFGLSYSTASCSASRFTNYRGHHTGTVLHRKCRCLAGKAILE